MKITLYPYQETAIEKAEAWLCADPTHRRGMLVLPTGSGKTITFAEMCRRLLLRFPDKRILVLVHTDELARQTVKALRAVAPDLVIGVVKARENDVTADVIVGSVMTLKNPKRLMQIRDVVRVIVDECDLAAAPTYMKILDYFGCFTPREDGRYDAKAIGVTATPFRTDGRVSSVWQEIVYTLPLAWMIKRKFLIPPRGIAITVPDLNLRDVKATKADFKTEELGEALAESLAPELVAKAIVEHCSNRKTLAFFPTVASAYVFAEAIEAAGIPAEVVHGGQPQAERDAILARHKRGTVVVNCMLLTVGYDDPEVDAILIGRPTKSKRLYIQIVGRGLRVNKSIPYDEQDCLLLDVVGANGLHDLRSMADLSEKALDPEKARTGKTLQELEDEFDAGEGVEEDKPAFYTGAVVSKEFDPLGAAKRSAVWIRTQGGTYFVPAGTDAYMFIIEYPKPDSWCVVWCAKDAASMFGAEKFKDPELRRELLIKPGTRKNVGMTIYRGLPLEKAMEQAELLAVDLGTDTINLANKKARWRTAPASQNLRNKAKWLRVRHADTIRAGELSDLIDRVQGTQRIDPLVKRVKGGR